MPAYLYDPYRYRFHKMKGGSFQDFTEKSYLPYSEGQIKKHFRGEQLIGIYPLLTDNTSWFIAADFDKTGWEDECRSFVKTCAEHSIAAYLERSRSGHGGHVWIFFEQPYPAVKSRKIFISLLEQCRAFSVFDKNSSFDRLFPNQNILSGKGLGNLIALPLHGPSVENGNSCFIDVHSFEPFADQWKFLESVQRNSVQKLDSIYSSITASLNQAIIPSQSEKNASGKLTIRLSNSVYINRTSLPSILGSFLKEELNFLNTEYIAKKKSGKSTWGTERYFRCIEESATDIIIPRGTIGKILRFCKENQIEYDFRDERHRLKPVPFTDNIRLRDYQVPAFQVVEKKDLGVIVAPPGTGKTVIALKIIADKKQPTLIIVHRKQLAEQWMERVQTFLGIPRSEIGCLGLGKGKTGKSVTIAMIQSLSKAMAKADNSWRTAFGTIIIDECHHVPAETFRNTIAQLHTYYLYGLTATPFRKYNDEKLIYIHLGEILAELKPQDVKALKRACIIIRNTELDIPFNPKTDRFETLSKVLVHDSARNKLIINDLANIVPSGKRVVILTERKEHIETLYQYLKHRYETITLSGDDPESARKSKWELLEEGNYQVLITTGQFFGEGTDLQNAECLFLVYPFSFEGKLVQYIGRVQRSEVAPVIYDYRDYKIEYLDKLFLKRNTYYRKLEKEATLFDDPDETSAGEKNFIFEQQVVVPLTLIDFRFGSFAFRCPIKKLNMELEFEIENNDIRPEFDVLKPYLSKLLQLKQVGINVFAEFVNDKLVSQIAHSSDLEKLNREIIESVKFRFIAKTYLGNATYSDSPENMLDINQLQTKGNGNHQLFDSEEEFIENVLRDQTHRHYRQIRYLASNHASDILKLRFVLSPFSFVFLLRGANHFHLVMETLDTEEATYIWHIENDLTVLKIKLSEIDQCINVMRNKGRLAFLESQPKNFNRIVHDYSDQRKGFILWKDFMEEMLD